MVASGTRLTLIRLLEQTEVVRVKVLDPLLLALMEAGVCHRTVRIHMQVAMAVLGVADVGL